MSDVFVAGASLTPFGKDFRPIGVMLADACWKALQNSSPFTYDLVPDCLVIGSMDPIGFARQTGLDSLVGMELKLRRDTEIYHVEMGSATGAGAVELGKRLASSGLKVLVCFGEKMKGKLRNEEIPSQISTVISEEERERGLGEMPAVAALASYEYMDAYKVSEKEFRNVCYEMSVSSLGHGSLNKFAYFKEPVTRKDYDNPEINRIIAKPLTKFDCSGSYNGAGAVYLISTPTDIKLTSVKSAFDNIKIAERKTLISMEAAVLAGRKCFQEAKLNPYEIDLCELHDAFKSVPWVAAEDLALAERGKGHRFVLDEKRISDVMERYHPQIVFHAAAYKHVPLMESNPYEAFKTNVIGTKIVAEKAWNSGAERFILISTDKAVNPINIMGMTKKIAEEIVRYLSSFATSTKYVMVRFGNVLASSGSVLPLFIEQIKRGGPVTVTHPEITRYFMTVPEAVNLVLKASTMGNGKEVFILDMGEKIKILDLAKRLISLYGYKPGVDIDIAFIGLRPGEKLYEELFNGDEVVRKTSYPKINMAISNRRINQNILKYLSNPELLKENSDIKDMLNELIQPVSETIKVEI